MDVIIFSKACNYSVVYLTVVSIAVRVLHTGADIGQWGHNSVDFTEE